MNIPRNYNLLRLIASILKVLAWVALVLAVIGIIVALAANLPGVLKLVGVVTALLVGIGWFVQLYAFGSILALLVDIETNTRMLASNPPAQ
jgi:hypothetical protein